MFPLDTLLTYLAAVMLVVISPGPDNILAISRGLSQGRGAAVSTYRQVIRLISVRRARTEEVALYES